MDSWPNYHNKEMLKDSKSPIEQSDFECDSQSIPCTFGGHENYVECPVCKGGNKIQKPGSERDKLIAKIKGFNFGPDDMYMSFLLPNWSNNRDDAWELWDELWESHEALNYRQYTGMTGKECHEVIAEIKVNDRVRMAYGDSFADAVSQVWLLWKRGNNA